MREMLRNPEVMRQAFNPANLQAMMQMQQAMQQLQSSGLMAPIPGMPSTPFPNFGAPGAGTTPGAASTATPAPGTAAPPSIPPFDFNAMMAAMGGGGAFPPATTAASTVPPEERFAVQLTKLSEMGFIDRDANIRALTASNGNVNAAIDRLLSGGF
jgi:ubiquilin